MDTGRKERILSDYVNACTIAMRKTIQDYMVNVLARPNPYEDDMKTLKEIIDRFYESLAYTPTTKSDAVSHHVSCLQRYAEAEIEKAILSVIIDSQIGGTYSIEEMKDVEAEFRSNLNSIDFRKASR